MDSLRRIGYRALLVIGIALVSFSGSRAVAQPMPLPAEQLDRVLDDWEQVMKGVTAFEGQVSQKRVSKRFETTETFEGRIRILRTEKAGLFASLELVRKDNPAIVEKLMLNDRGFCQYDFAAKEVRVHPIAFRPDRSDNPIGFLFGIKAQDLKKRFDLQLAGQDQTYSYIRVLPKTDADKGNFQSARLSLVRKTSMPAQLWFQAVNRDETQWDLPHVDLQAPLQPRDFAVAVPAGWRAIEAPRPSSAADSRPTSLPPVLK